MATIPIGFFTYQPGTLVEVRQGAGLAVKTANAQGYVDFGVTAPGDITGTMRAAGYEDYPFALHVEADWTQHDWFLTDQVMPEPGFPKQINGRPYQSVLRPLVAKHLPRIRTQGMYFVTEQGTLWTWMGASAFNAFRFHLEGRLDEAVLRQYTQTGANVLRVFANWGDQAFDPASFPSYFDHLPVFLQRVARYQAYVEFVLFAPKPLCPSLTSPGAQIEFANRCYAATVGATNIIWELANEPVQDGFDVSHLPAPPGLWSSGIYDGPGRRGHFLTYHARRTMPKLILEMAPVETRYTDGYPCVSDEPARPDHYDFNPQVAWEMGALARGQNGGTFHSREGTATGLWAGSTLACAQAFYRGLRGDPRP